MNNGKSTFLSVLYQLLAEYAQQADFTSFLHKDREAIRNDIAMLKGACFVSAVEAKEGKRLAEVLVKQLTGGDPVTARFLHRENFTFTPQLKLWLAANHKPRITGTDHGRLAILCQLSAVGLGFIEAEVREGWPRSFTRQLLGHGNSGY